jgi:dolichol-phosphate mannosyltransferase
MQPERVNTSHGAVDGAGTAVMEDRSTSIPATIRDRILGVTAVYNEERRIGVFVEALKRPGPVDAFVVVNDGSTDRSADLLRENGIQVLDQPHLGLGAAIKHAVRFARTNGFTVLVLFAGNGKDNPDEIPRLVAPILNDTADYVQGSRYLPGGSHANTPIFRLVTIRILSWLFSHYMGRPCTDLTNGFRAYRLALLDDPRLSIEQTWLDNYEFEYYVHWYAYKLGYRVTEVPVSKTYPGGTVPYSKIRPLTGWWRMLRPLVYLGLGIKK